MSIRLRPDTPGNRWLWLSGAFDHQAAHDQKIHFCIHKTTVGIVRRADDWFAADVEGCIHQHAATCGAFKTPQQFVKQRVVRFRHSLYARGVIHMRDGGKRRAKFLEQIQAARAGNEVSLWARAGADTIGLYGDGDTAKIGA